LNPAPAARRILLVEDDDDTRQLMVVALEGQGYAVRQAERADEALGHLRRGPYDLVLTDYDLPGMTGASLLREANRERLLQGTATLVVTAHPDPQGVDDTTLVRKPLDLEKFLLQIRRIFDGMGTGPRATAAAPATPAAADLEEVADLVLYVSPDSPSSHRARRNLDKLLEQFPAERLVFQVVDLSSEPARAEDDKIVFTPTLLKRRPDPPAWILGDLGDPGVVVDLLHMCGIQPVP
jgi:CheY-like chemotaxis protein